MNKRLTVGEKADAREALQILEGSGLSLSQAAKLALHLDEGGRYKEMSIELAIDAFLAKCRDRVKAGTMRARTADYYEENLWPFESEFPGKLVDDLTRKALEKYFDQLPIKETSKESRFRAVRAWLNWCEKQDPALVRSNPIRKVHREPVVREEDIQFLFLDQVKHVLKARTPYRWAIALQLFAGLRPEEISSPHKPSLEWRHINREEKQIRIPANIAKGSRGRSMGRIIDQAPDNLWSWLKDAPASGPVFPYHPSRIQKMAAKLAGFGPEKPWIHDGLRKTFCTYHVAAYNDVGKTSLIMGHRGDPRMIHQHYRGLVVKTAGEEYFSLVY